MQLDPGFSNTNRSIANTHHSRPRMAQSHRHNTAAIPAIHSTEADLIEGNPTLRVLALLNTAEA